MGTKHIMILGCGRSGTSIFGEFFETLPDYTYWSEPPLEKVLQHDYKTPMAIKVPREDTKYGVTDGLSVPLPLLLKTIPNLQIFWIVRHPLDAICSLRVGIAKNWGHHPQPPDWKNWLQRPLIERCAHHWNYLNSVGYNSVQEYAKVVRFEDMLMNTPDFTKVVTETANIIGYETAIITWTNRVQNTNNEYFIEAKTSKPYSRKDHKVRVGRWKENLTKEEIKQIKPIIEITAQKFGYSLPND